MPERVLIFTDLDGTLLDHYTYKADAALSTLAQLAAVDIPVILNTSKTKAELTAITKELAITTPFIVENGAAVFIPISTFAQQPEDTVQIDNYWVKSFCLPRQHWLDLLTEHCQAFHKNYKGFSQLTVEQLIELTGLTQKKAEQAKQRLFGEPLHWQGSDSEKEDFIQLLCDLGANVLQGGRFLHVSGYSDKGQAMIWLASLYRDFYNDNEVVTIALGDGDNDIAMLEAANIAIQVRSPVNDFPVLKRQVSTIKTQGYGPQGWAESLQQLLSSKLTKGA
ncbi:HAD-IIB family hydrolase [Thalassotalea profundi]|uniref:Mannosyl-3-phosphoglycerate phosphatase n=1 Tax=Thalassotalea profundi TaxID=2036687 RepID=A0ABQ3IX15_9GAMM|nr:HAD-IIB family hydrolase [Thalassotalea profundi]GHE97383.1 mannosyl-3-phosphoglycerate phosphatase [Thalassotalea profundi]